MKNRILAGMAIVCLCVCSACGGSSTTEKEKASAYHIEDGEYYEGDGYQIMLTNNWARANNANTDLAFSYKNSKNDIFTESICSIIQDLSGEEADLEKYKNTSIEQYSKLNYDIDTCEKTQLDGNYAYDIVSHTTNADSDVYCKQVFTIVNDKAYIFTFAAAKADYDKLESEVTAIFDTIEFGNFEDGDDASNTESSESVSSEAVSSEDNVSDGASSEANIDSESASSEDSANDAENTIE